MQAENMSQFERHHRHRQRQQLRQQMKNCYLMYQHYLLRQQHRLLQWLLFVRMCQLIVKQHNKDHQRHRHQLRYFHRHRHLRQLRHRKIELWLV
jgi:hypothetical protein